MTTPLVVVHHDADVLAEAVAARLITRIADVQAARGEASVVLTGGGVGTASLAAIARSPARSAVDWGRLEVWWGDERFLPTGHGERNETQARAALLDQVPVRVDRVHPMPASDAGDVRGDPEAAADLYRTTLRASAHPENHSRIPAFDVLLLGVGPDAHVASLFPDQPALYETRPVVAVHGAPKPPPIRLTLTLPAIRSAKEVWLVVAGEEKAAAVRMALSGAGEVQVPAAGARGRHRTLWLLDRGAASALPRGLERIASP
jgi:6-phosphogluconolactonase